MLWYLHVIFVYARLCQKNFYATFSASKYSDIPTVSCTFVCLYLQWLQFGNIFGFLSSVFHTWTMGRRYTPSRRFVSVATIGSVKGGEDPGIEPCWNNSSVSLHLCIKSAGKAYWLRRSSVPLPADFQAGIVDANYIGFTKTPRACKWRDVWQNPPK